MRVLSLAAVAVVCASFSSSMLSSSARAGEKFEPDPQVTYATSWEAAVEEARLLNVPIVVHSHGFYCGPCWGLHSAICKNKKYIEFSEKHTVEVMCLQRLQEGIDKQEERAETYEVTVDGVKVAYLKEFPGLTVAQMLALATSKGGTYNDTGGIPYTCLVDPHTLANLKFWKGGQASAGALEEAVLEVRKQLEKEHGKGVARKDLRTLDAAERTVAALQEKGEFAQAVGELTKVAGKAKDWPEGLTGRLAKAKEAVVAAATTALDGLEAQAASEPAAARKELSRLLPKLKGTGLEERAKALLAAWAPAAAPAR